MRKYAILRKPIDQIYKVMVFESKEGIYIFEYDTVKDHPCSSDYYFDTKEEAEIFLHEKFGLRESDWITIDDPQEYCQDDLISPIRLKGRDIGKPVFGEYEILHQGKWVKHSLE